MAVFTGTAAEETITPTFGSVTPGLAMTAGQLTNV
jgi:hypothetical protein